MKKCIPVLALAVLCGCASERHPLYAESKEVRSNNVSDTTIKSIEGRHGQIVRNNLLELIRDYPNSFSGYVIEIKLKRDTEGVLYEKNGDANRLMIEHGADIIVRSKETYEIVLQDSVSIPQSMNISNSAGEVMLSLYSEYESYALKRLAQRIFENLNMKLGRLNASKKNS